jgi:Trypsin-like peptidase domain
MVDRRPLFFPVFQLSMEGRPVAHVGNAFPVTADNGLLTCRHVIELRGADDSLLPVGVMNTETGHIKPVEAATVPDAADLDLAFIADGVERESRGYFPLLPDAQLALGTDVFSLGYYTEGAAVESLTAGYFSGKIVTGKTGDPERGDWGSLALAYAVIEGVSGSAIVTYHHGNKLVGICHGSLSQRVMAYEVIDMHDGDVRYREQVHRIVEFGQGYPAGTIEWFLRSQSIERFTVTADRVDIPDIEQ